MVMKTKTVFYKVKGKVKKIKNIVYENRNEATMAKLYFLAQKSFNKLK